jgi:hypothetical protein
MTAPVTFNYDAFRQTKPGYIDLLDEDKDELHRLLNSNNGSKEAIQGLRTYVVSRAHSLYSSVGIMKDFVYSIRDSKESFNRILYTIYVLNDILFYSKDATTLGPYTEGSIQHGYQQKVDVVRCMLPFLPSILWASFNAGDSVGCDRLKKIVDMWGTRDIVDNATKQSLINAMNSSVAVDAPPQIALTKPLTPRYSASTQNAPFPPQLPLGVYPQHAPFPPQLHPELYPYPQQSNLLPHPFTNPMQPPQVSIASHIAIDLSKISVGNMSNLVRQSLKSSRIKYAALDPTSVGSLVAPAVEPGRLDVRINDFYNRLSDLDRRQS